ncbi:MAG: PD-(D/E)XK nuclease family protein [Candidatus Aenigmatarchaeota archaeon]
MPSSPSVKPLKLSPSSLNAFRDCPKCFWLDMNGKGAPPGFPMALLCVMDGIQKRYYDSHRAEGLPPMLKGKVPFKLVDLETAEKLRHYITWNDEQTGAVLRGKMDDCFIDRDGTLVVMDNKTRSGEFKEIYDGYMFQLDTYAFLLAKNGFKVGKTGYIVYFVPDKESDMEKGVKFDVDVKSVELHPGRVLGVFRDAVKLARQAKPPANHKECEMCAWVAKMGEM